MNMVQILGELPKILPPMKAIEEKNVPPIMHVEGRIYFSMVSSSSKIDQYSSAIILLFTRQILLLDMPSLTTILFLQTCIQGKPQSTPYMDVVTIDI